MDEPATADVIGIPASIIAMLEAHTEPMDEEPFDERVSETSRMVYGKVSFDGTTARRAFSASAPWPISRRPGPRMGRVSPTENGGKL